MQSKIKNMTQKLYQRSFQMEYRISNELAKAREYEKEQEALIKEEDRPV